MGNHLSGQTATVVQLHFKSTSRLFFTAVVMIQIHLELMNVTVQTQLLYLGNHVLIEEPERLTPKEAGDKTRNFIKSTGNKSRNTRTHEGVINT